ncbi:MAG TPA: gliding motility-associated C-terminal domain-containing protein [Bacteroidales bacterium]|nr:gliding motility-associated C-terminal domain-containing protein [Bacteroidales bacterium]HPS51201.1 gliding motility-associated C-terminal domain-containing protein [Bacteroidales bacterium]
MRIRFGLLPVALLWFFMMMAPFSASATHQRAAEIVYRHISELTYEIKLISYTFTPSPANAYREYLTIDWGDGQTSEIHRDTVKYLPNDITYNVYIGRHSFPGPSTYIISCEDPNRNGGILNIPNSVNTPLFIYSELTISPFIGGFNNSPVLLLPPIDNGCVDQPYYHNPGAWDADGDSLSYRLVPCRGAGGQVIPGYSFPQASNHLSLNPVTGDLLWDSPQKQGEYNIAILIEEWRNGIRIGSILRDMQIIVVACNNHPPVIYDVADTCVEAGKNLRFPVRAYDSDSNTVTLSGTGGPLVINNNPATLEPNPASGYGHTLSLFRWNTVCDHIRNQPYQLFFKAQDNAKPVNLVTLKTINILVIGPAPENLSATPMGNSITLNWDPYACQNASGFDIYRKADSTGYLPGYCQTGVPVYLGYSRIASVNDHTTTTYLDDNNGTGLQQGIRYCYLIIAVFTDKSESYASNEACAALKKDLPVMTNVSITSTHGSDGTIYTAWSKPTEIDTLQAPGPYKYILNRARSDSPDDFLRIDSTNNLNDTIFNDAMLNTSTFEFIYRVDFYNETPGNRFLMGSSQPAASMFLTTDPTDKSIRLNWSDKVPWANDRFIIFRKDPGSAGFDSVGQSLKNSFMDKGLINGERYCYRIRSVGKYSAPGFVYPIINESQETCDIPVDNIPPCPPLLTVKTNCEDAVNQLSWKIPADSCPTDIEKYYIYYSSTPGYPLLIDSLLHPMDTTYLHAPYQSIVGCYGVVAIDSMGNKSEMSPVICVDITACPGYSLPNIFTPNGDGSHDLFRPVHRSSVSEIDLTIFDRWGKAVFKTHDPEINWDGKDMNTGQSCSDGTYFFVCDVNEVTLNGIVKRNIHGSLTLLR